MTENVKIVADQIQQLLRSQFSISATKRNIPERVWPIAMRNKVHSHHTQCQRLFWSARVESQSKNRNCSGDEDGFH